MSSTRQKRLPHKFFFLDCLKFLNEFLFVLRKIYNKIINDRFVQDSVSIFSGTTTCLKDSCKDGSGKCYCTQNKCNDVPGCTNGLEDNIDVCLGKTSDVYICLN